jgi:hypothetical protein
MKFFQIQGVSIFSLPIGEYLSNSVSSKVRNNEFKREVQNLRQRTETRVNNHIR